LLEWIAMITMLIDHLGVTFFPEVSVMRRIGRIAFPLYCFFIVLGLSRTRNQKRYLKRLLFIALISQIPYNLVFPALRLNVVFGLLTGAILIYIYENNNSKLKWILIAGIGILVFILNDYISYGIYGVLLCLLYYFLKDEGFILVCGHIILNLMTNYLQTGSFISGQMLSVLGTFIIIWRNKLPNMLVPRKFYQAFYPLHLLIIGIFSHLL
jgi:hypothetical protein